LFTKNLDADLDEANRTKTVKSQALRILVSLVIACGLLNANQTRAAAGPAKSAFVFDGVGYLHRWSLHHQHEFTPEGQEDLEKWSDMITINVYPDAHDGEALAIKANAVLENYKSHNGKVLRTSSVPRTPRQPAEHFVVVVFGRPNFIEVALARFKLVDGLGCSIVFSHRKRSASDCVRERLPADRLAKFRVGGNCFYNFQRFSGNWQHSAAAV
jgi:hypothetical protein